MIPLVTNLVYLYRIHRKIKYIKGNVYTILEQIKWKEKQLLWYESGVILYMHLHFFPLFNTQVLTLNVQVLQKFIVADSVQIFILVLTSSLVTFEPKPYHYDQIYSITLCSARFPKTFPKQHDMKHVKF